MAARDDPSPTADPASDPGVSAVLAELRVLARRCAAGVRTEGSRRGHGPDTIDEAIELAWRLDGADELVRRRTAELLGALGSRLAATGRPAAGLRVAEASVALWDQLPGPSDRHAMALNELGILLLRDGRAADGLVAARRSVAMRRRLAHDDPAIRPGLAASLQNLDTHLSAAGDHEAAADAITEATALYRELADIDPPTFLPRLAAALHNEGLTLSEVERPDRASAAAEEAAWIYGRLVEDDPARLPELAETLLNLTCRLAGSGHWRDAAVAAGRSADAYERAGDRRGARAMRRRRLRYRLRGLGRR